MRRLAAPESAIAKTTDIHYSAKYCAECHENTAQKNGPNSLKYGGDFKQLCRCHAKESKQPMHAKHLRKPSPKVLTTIKSLETQENIILPLDQDGKTSCATCHNPHEKGVIPDKREGAKGAGETRRHRLSGILCIKCHPMQ